ASTQLRTAPLSRSSQADRRNEETHTVTAHAARRRHPLATALLVLVGLVVTGSAYAAIIPGQANAAQTQASPEDVAAGRKLYLANCATCHGLHAEGRLQAPSLIGVGAAAADFQVGTGRMPLAATGPQAPQGPRVDFTDAEIQQMAAYVASLAPGPPIPSAEMVDASLGNPSRGALLFSLNCAMCHNFAGKGGA